MVLKGILINGEKKEKISKSIIINKVEIIPEGNILSQIVMRNILRIQSFSMEKELALSNQYQIESRVANYYGEIFKGKEKNGQLIQITINNIREIAPKKPNNNFGQGLEPEPLILRGPPRGVPRGGPWNLQKSTLHQKKQKNF